MSDILIAGGNIGLKCKQDRIIYNPGLQKLIKLDQQLTCFLLYRRQSAVYHAQLHLLQCYIRDLDDMGLGLDL